VVKSGILKNTLFFKYCILKTYPYNFEKLKHLLYYCDMSDIPKFIDLAKLFQEKSPKLYKWTPNFILNWLRNVIHEDEVNIGLHQGGDKKDIDFARYTIFDVLGSEVKGYGHENIPKEGGFILFSNHPLGGMDGMALLIEVGKTRPDIQFLVNDLLLKLGKFDGVFVPINKHGVNAKSQLEKIDKIYASDCATLVFPAGLCSRLQAHNDIMDLEWTKSFVAKAIKYNKILVPCYIEARNSNWFYKLGYWRKKFGIKANLEMLYLADEMFKQKGKTTKIYFGKPFRSELLTKDKSHHEWAQILKAYVYEKRTQIPVSDFTI
jgi:putative hemolysin